MVEEMASCTICAPGSNEQESPGFYHGCLCADSGGVCNGWKCDGKGNLTRADMVAISDEL